MSAVAKLWHIAGIRPARQCLALLRSIEEKRQIQILTEHNGRFYTTEAQLRNVVPEAFAEDLNTQETIQHLKQAIL